MTSSGFQNFDSDSAIWSMFTTKLSCVSMVPFGRPVVPEEYGKAAKSSPCTPFTVLSIGASQLRFSSHSDFAFSSEPPITILCFTESFSVINNAFCAVSEADV